MIACIDIVVVVTIYSFQSITQSIERVFEKLNKNSGNPNNQFPDIANLRPLLSKAKSPSLFVRRFDEEDIKLVLVSRIQLLGTCKQDRERAEKTDVIQKAYNHAVAILRGDV